MERSSPRDVSLFLKVEKSAFEKNLSNLRKVNDPQSISS